MSITPSIPAYPNNVNLQQGNGQVYLSWDISAGATSYTIQRSTDGVTFATVGTSTSNSYLDTTVATATLYYYQVASVNAVGMSPYSSPQSIIPTLSGQMALGQVRLMAQQRADRENSQFLKTPEWNANINQSYYELYDLLVTLYEDFYVQTPYVISLTGLTTYPLPADFYKLLGVDMGPSQSGTAWTTLSKFDFVARNRNASTPGQSSIPGMSWVKYRVFGTQIIFDQAPAAGQFIRLWYVPRVTQLLKDNDLLDGVSGWTEYVIVDAAIKALQKEESDVAVLMAQKAALRLRIEETAMNRDAGAPDTISDTRGSSDDFYRGGGWR